MNRTGCAKVSVPTVLCQSVCACCAKASVPTVPKCLCPSVCAHCAKVSVPTVPKCLEVSVPTVPKCLCLLCQSVCASSVCAREFLRGQDFCDLHCLGKLVVMMNADRGIFGRLAGRHMLNLPLCLRFHLSVGPLRFRRRAYWKMSFDGRPYSTASYDDIDQDKRPSHSAITKSFFAVCNVAKLYSSGLQTASAL